EPGILPRIDAGCDTIVNERVHLLGFFGRQILRNIEILDFAGDLRAERRGIETADAANAGTAVYNVIPGLRYFVSDWGNNAQTCNDNASFHGWLLPFTVVKFNHRPEIKK